MYIYFSTLQSSLNCSYCEANESAAFILNGLQGASYGPFYLSRYSSMLSIYLLFLLWYLLHSTSRDFASSMGAGRHWKPDTLLTTELKPVLPRSDQE